MERYISITGYKSRTYDGRIITFGLSDKENYLIKALVNNKNFEVYIADVASDLVAIIATAIVVNAEKLEPYDLELLENYYIEVNTEANEIVFWLASPKPTIGLQMLFNCFDSYEDMIVSLKNILEI